MDYNKRVKSLIERISLEGLKVAVVFGESNLLYYTGTDAGKALIVSSDQSTIILSSSLDYDRALKEKALGDVYLYSEYLDIEEDKFVKGDLITALNTILTKIGVSGEDVGFTLNSLSYENYLSLRKILGKEPKDISKLVARMRSIKDKEELEIIRKAIEVSQEALRKGIDSLERGIREIDVLRIIEDVFRHRGAFNAFTPIVVFGDHGAQPHAVPGARELKEGDLVIIDLGARLEGYCSDVTRTLVYGKSSEKQRRLLKVVLRAQREAIEAIKSGVKASYIDEAARSVLKEEGLSQYFIHGTGHGVGVDIHELPYITPTSKDDLVAGMVVTVEPGVYIRGYGGVRVEDMVLVRSGDYELLTSFERDLF